ncbi:hypothetical protein CLPUN_41770 [Clostridium puniceum]|uniref:Uncharacterized protein n=1 Tax=Clostridium puniceum TaxID=29367 RepID=A0A1S8T8B3_9CLOT|nr:hypothetical protein CLPUN_41770 [Clostridium puniceum]
MLDIGTSYLRKIGLNEKEEEALYKILSLNLLKLVAQRDNNTSLPANEQQDDLNNVNKKVNSMNPKDENRFHNLLRDSKKHLEIYKILGGLD